MDSELRCTTWMKGSRAHMQRFLLYPSSSQLLGGREGMGGMHRALLRELFRALSRWLPLPAGDRIEASPAAARSRRRDPPGPVLRLAAASPAAALPLPLAAGSLPAKLSAERDTSLGLTRPDGWAPMLRLSPEGGSPCCCAGEAAASEWDALPRGGTMDARCKVQDASQGLVTLVLAAPT